MPIQTTSCGCCETWASPRRRPLRDVLGQRCPFPALSSKFTTPKGRCLFHQGDWVNGAFSLGKGMVALERVDENGELVIIKILHPGAFFPCADLLDRGVHESSARALTDVTGCFVPADRLRAAVRTDPDISLALLKLSAMEIRENEETIFRLCSSDLPDRVMSILTTLADEAGQRAADGSLSMTLPVSWRDLAAMAGTGPEVISRLLRRLSDAGRLSFHGRHVTIYPAARPIRSQARHALS